MSKAAAPRSRAVLRLEEIGSLDPPWPNAFALRALLRVFPKFAAEGSPSGVKTALSAALLRYFYLGALRWEAQYRELFDEATGWHNEREEKEFIRLRHEIGERWGDLDGTRFKAELILPVPPFLAQNATKKPQLGIRALAKLDEWLGRSAPGIHRAEVESDWHWCHPLGSVEPQHLREFLSRALWDAQPPPGFVRELGNELLASIDQALPKSGEPGAGEIVRLYWDHVHRPLDWDRLRKIVLTERPEPVDEAAAAALRQIAANPEQIAKLLAGIALRDRRHCDLAVKPSVALFLEAVIDAGIKSPAKLVAFAAKVAKDQSRHAPNALWLAWLQNNHDAALESIRRELESWLPAAAETPAEAPTPSAPIKSAAPRRSTAKRPVPGAKPRPKKAAVKKRK